MFATEFEIKPAFIWGGRMLEPYAAAYIATVLQLPYSQCIPKKIQRKADANVLEGTEYGPLKKSKIKK